jgi:acyl-coenzyme A synthetase/AMP-(fatty) acid ligase
MAGAPDRARTRIHQLMDSWVAGQPDATALGDAFAALSYRELHDASVAAARQLQALGLPADDRLLVVGENCVALGVWVLAASRPDVWSERAIKAHPEVIQSAVVGRTVQHNEEVVAFVERAAGSALDEGTLRAHLRASLEPYKIPSEIRFLSPLPAAPTGKLLKGVMKTMAQQPADASTAAPMH